jgi:hypothetical protein
VARVRSLLKSVFRLLLAVCVLWGTMRALMLIDEHLFRRRAEALLTEIQSLELRRTPSQTTEKGMQPWKADSKVYEPCDTNERCIEATLDDFFLGLLPKAALLVRVDDYIRWRFRLSYAIGPFSRFINLFVLEYMRMGGRLSRVTASVEMRDSVVWSKGFSIHIETVVGAFRSR